MWSWWWLRTMWWLCSIPTCVKVRPWTFMQPWFFWCNFMHSPDGRSVGRRRSCPIVIRVFVATDRSWFVIRVIRKTSGRYLKLRSYNRIMIKLNKHYNSWSSYLQGWVKIMPGTARIILTDNIRWQRLWLVPWGFLLLALCLVALPVHAGVVVLPADALLALFSLGAQAFYLGRPQVVLLLLIFLLLVLWTVQFLHVLYEPEAGRGVKGQAWLGECQRPGGT